MDKKFTNLAILLIVVASLFLILLLSAIPGKSVIFNAFSTLIRAKEEVVPSADKSIILCFPLEQNANNKDSIKVSVFVRGSDQKALSDHSVALSTTVGTSAPASLKTDKSGEAGFLITSQTPGTTEVTAVVDGTLKLSNTCRVSFK